jgi:hypothetical protein
MPAEALHIATTTPMIRATTEPDDVRLVADWTAWLNTPEAPGGSALSRPLTSRVTVPPPTCTRLVTPSSAISAGNRARNQ